MLIFQVPEPTMAHGIAFDPQTGEIHLLGDGGARIPIRASHVQITYDRLKGKKVTVRAPVKPDHRSIQPNTHFAAYAAVFAIDTNTIPIRGVPVSVSCIIQWSIKQFPTGLKADLVDMAAFELYNVVHNPERLGWWLGIDRIKRMSLSPDAQIGVVVDSSLETLESINKRETPIVENLFLPSGISLIFASDVSVDSLANKFIRICDTLATQILNHVESTGSTVHLLQGPPGSMFSHYRCWQMFVDPISQVRKIGSLIP